MTRLRWNPLLPALLTAGLVAASISVMAQSARPATSAQVLPSWRHEGGGTVRVEGDEIVMTASPTGAPNLLVHDQSYYDVGLRVLFRCAGECVAGVILRREKTAEGTAGYITSLSNTDAGIVSRIRFDAQGREIGRQQVPDNRTTRGGGGRGAGGRGVAGGRGAAAPAEPPVRNVPTADELPPAQLVANGWNDTDMFVRGQDFNGHMNRRRIGGDTGGGFYEGAPNGPVAIYVASGELRFKIREISDLTRRASLEPVVVSDQFTMHHVSDVFQADGMAVGDIDRDGNLDVVVGPYYYLGPDFKWAREIHRTGATGNFTYVEDFNADGWPDVLHGSTLWVNPKGEARHWTSAGSIGQAGGEVMTMADVDGDGKKDLVCTSQGRVGYFTRSADGTSPWTFHPVSDTGRWGGHGLGAGDVNADGRVDILKGFDNNGGLLPEWAGWFEQPPAGRSGPWTFHRAPFGAGAEMFVYDVNNDKLPDVITALYAHGYGLLWLEQKRSAAGEISFVEHFIMDGPDDIPMYGAAFSELHALGMGDINGDGLMDLVAGKRWMIHGDTYLDVDAYGPAVLYWFELSRPASGQPKYIPRLIHNNSGAGAHLVTADLNKDGRADVMSATRKGTFIFISKAGRDGATGPATRRTN